MAWSSVHSSNLYYLLPQAPAEAEAMWIAWPALAFEASAPVRERDELDLIEQAVLGLAVAGEVGPERIAKHLHLDARLVARLLQVFFLRNWVDARGNPTDAGQLAYATGVGHHAKFRTGSILQDLVTGELHPYFDQLRPVPVTRKRDQIVALVGPHGSRVRLTCRIVMPQDDQRPPLPDVGAVLDACRAYATYASGADSTADSTDERAKTISRVSVFEGDGELVLLATAIVNVGRDASATWAVLDPIRGVPSEPLSAAVQHRLALLPALEQELQQFLAQAAQPTGIQPLSATTPVGNNLAAGWPAQIRVDAEFRDLESAVRDLQTAGDHDTPRKARAVVVEASTALEAVFARLNRRHPPHRALQALAAIPTGLHRPPGKLVRTKASMLGFAAVPETLLRWPPSGLLRELAQPAPRLTAMIAAAIVAAAADSLHPLRQIAHVHPTMLRSIAQLLTLRNAGAAHRGRQWGLLTRAQAEEALTLCHTLADLLPDLVSTEVTPDVQEA